ncbi:MAG: 23S rRNA pseudouridine(955/2504/2580) synthase RluC [Gammaproteobacteria bacterium]|nr:23S rRNA pseudouridine(955/2504/2580) synthase RluC [Gammaproteobacteria bacterium]
MAVSTFNQVQLITIDENNINQRVDNFLVSRLKGVPKSRIYRIIRKGEVRVNKKRVKAEYKLKNNDEVRIPPIRTSDDIATIDFSQFDRVKSLESHIIFENTQFIVLNKPSGMAVHGGSGLSFGVIEALRSIRPKDKFLELAHRLDRDTSGCLLIAKRRSYLKHFQQQLVDKTMNKEYLAIVSGLWPKGKQAVNASLLKNRLKSGERFVKVDETGKKAKTIFECVEQYSKYSLVRAKPITGRTHQIRVHAQHHGFPLLGDDKYSDLLADIQIMDKLKIKTFLLHSTKLCFTAPESDKVMSFEAPIPDKMQQVIDYLQSSSS